MESVKDIERILKALANRRRLLILKFVRQKGWANVGSIAQEIKLSFKATSKHLQILAAANLVESEQVSLVVNYRLKLPTHKILKVILESIQ